MKTPNFKILSIRPDMVVINDVGPWDVFPTVTNNPETTIETLRSGGVLVPGARLFYLDSYGDKGELKMGEDGKFEGYGCMGERDEVVVAAGKIMGLGQ